MGNQSKAELKAAAIVGASGAVAASIDASHEILISLVLRLIESETVSAEDAQFIFDAAESHARRGGHSERAARIAELCELIPWDRVFELRADQRDKGARV